MAVGIDIGGTKMELAIYDQSMEPGESWRIPTPGRSYAAFLKAIAEMVQRADAICGMRQAVGLAVPGVVDGAGQSISIHVPCINGKRVVADIERSIERPVAHDNDIRAFTLSEACGGALAGVPVAIGVILGTGVGGTLCIDGRLHRGRRGIAGEYGHMPIPKSLIDKYGLHAQARCCACGGEGCAEQFLSGPSLLQAVKHLGAPYTSVHEMMAEVRKGSPPACWIFEAFIECLGYFISRLTLMLGPDVVVFGGGLSSISEIYSRLPEAITAYLFAGTPPPTVSPPKFGAAGGARGAAILAMEAAHPDCPDDVS